MLVGMHADFYSVAITISLVFLLGGVFLLHWVTSHAGQGRWWLIPPLYTLLVVPTVAVALISLAVLSGMVPETRGGQWAVILLVCLQMAGGLGGLYGQAASVKIDAARTGETSAAEDVQAPHG